MRLRRGIIIALAWAPVCAAVILIAIHLQERYPGWAGLVMRALQERPSSPGDVRYISRFRGADDLERWRRSGALLVNSGSWGRIIFRSGESLPGIRLTDYTFGPAGARDWSAFRVLAWDMRAAPEATGKINLLIKDAGERRFGKAYPLGGGAKSASLDLSEANPWVDLTRMAEIHFFLSSTQNDVAMELKDVRLERRGAAPGEVLGRPFVVFQELDIQAEAKRGELITVTPAVSLTSAQKIRYSVFLHFFLESEKDIEPPSNRAGYLHLEYIPLVPVSDWPENTQRELGPFSVFIPRSNPPGKYLIRCGLFNPDAPGNGPRDVPYRGAYDFSGTYPKCRFKNPEIRDYVVGSIVVKE